MEPFEKLHIQMINLLKKRDELIEQDKQQHENNMKTFDELKQQMQDLYTKQDEINISEKQKYSDNNIDRIGIAHELNDIGIRISVSNLCDIQDEIKELRQITKTLEKKLMGDNQGLVIVGPNFPFLLPGETI